MATLTLDQQKAQAVEAGARAADELVRLREQRQRLALDALSGKAGVAGAAKALADVDAKIAELVRQQELAALAVQEADRREQEARRQEADAQRVADEAELARLTAERDARYRAVEDLLGRLAPEVEAALAAGAGIYDARVRLGHPAAPDWTGRALYNRVCERLGPLGAGVRDFDTPPPTSRSPLVDGAERG